MEILCTETLNEQLAPENQVLKDEISFGAYFSGALALSLRD